MAEVSADEFEAACERERMMFESEPHARSGRFGCVAYMARERATLRAALDDALQTPRSHAA